MANSSLLADHIRSLEESLLSPAVRSSAEALSQLLAEEFIEFGSSGLRFERQEIIDSLAVESGVRFALSDFALRPLAPDVALATYQVARAPAAGGTARRSWRSSVWQRIDGRWRMLFHQGTPIPERAE